jgi:hypothetical protein
MTRPDPTTFTGVPKLEDVMASLAKQSIFDLPTVARKMVDEAQKKAEAENDPGDVGIIVSSHYVIWHSEVEVL